MIRARLVIVHRYGCRAIAPVKWNGESKRQRRLGIFLPLAQILRFVNAAVEAAIVPGGTLPGEVKSITHFSPLVAVAELQLRDPRLIIVVIGGTGAEIERT